MHWESESEGERERERERESARTDAQFFTSFQTLPARVAGRGKSCLRQSRCTSPLISRFAGRSGPRLPSAEKGKEERGEPNRGTDDPPCSIGDGSASAKAVDSGVEGKKKPRKAWH